MNNETQNEFGPGYSESNRLPGTWMQRNGRGLVGTVLAGGLVGTVLAVVSIGIGKSLQRQPFKLENADFGGNMYNREDGTVKCAFYRSDGMYTGDSMPNRYVVRNEDKKFDQAEAYDAKGPHLQGKYNILGYTTFLGKNVATSIVPVKATSK